MCSATLGRPDGLSSKMQRPPVLNGILERTAMRFLRSMHRMPVNLRAIENQRVLVVAPSR
jgi:hypothetical protein